MTTVFLPRKVSFARSVSIALALLLALSAFTPLFAQSGRNRTTQANGKSEKGESKSGASTTTDTAKDPNSELEEQGLTESRVGEGGETPEDDIVRIDTSLVLVPVSVMDRNGKYVPYLRRQDFRLYEDGVQQKIAYFATVDQPFTVVLVLDTSGSTEYRLDEIQDAALTFVTKLKPEDSVMVMEFDDGIDVRCKPTTDRDVIKKAIRRTKTGGGTRLYDAVDNVFRKQLGTISGRKAVVLFTDGVDTTSYNATFDSTLRDAEEADAPVYSLNYNTEQQAVLNGGMGRGGIFGIPLPRPGLPGPGSQPGVYGGDYRLAERYLRTISDRTGGRYYNAGSIMGIGQAFTWIAEELGRQYSLGYYPKVSARDGERRMIKVRTVETDLVVKARGSYIPSSKKPAQPTPESTKEQKNYERVGRK